MCGVGCYVASTHMSFLTELTGYKIRKIRPISVFRVLCWTADDADAADFTDFLTAAWRSQFAYHNGIACILAVDKCSQRNLAPLYSGAGLGVRRSTQPHQGYSVIQPVIIRPIGVFRVLCWTADDAARAHFYCPLLCKKYWLTVPLSSNCSCKRTFEAK